MAIEELAGAHGPPALQLDLQEAQHALAGLHADRRWRGRREGDDTTGDRVLAAWEHGGCEDFEQLALPPRGGFGPWLQGADAPLQLHRWPSPVQLAVGGAEGVGHSSPALVLRLRSDAPGGPVRKDFEEELGADLREARGEAARRISGLDGDGALGDNRPRVQAGVIFIIALVVLLGGVWYAVLFGRGRTRPS